MNLLLLEPGERVLSRRDPRARHVRKVLRLGDGETLRAGEVDGPIGTATIHLAGDGGLALDFVPTVTPTPLPPVSLLLGHPRPIVLRRLLRDLSAIGPGRILVTHTELGEKSYYEANLWDDARSPMVEGAAQGGTTLLPRLERFRSLQAAVAALDEPPAVDATSPTAVPLAARGPRLVLHAASDTAGSGSPHLASRLSGGRAGPGAAIAVGSERGWTPGELALLLDSGFEACSLGERILRTETAALVAAWTCVSWYHRDS